MLLRRTKAVDLESQIVPAPTAHAARKTAAVSPLLPVASSSAGDADVSQAPMQHNNVLTTQPPEPRMSSGLVSVIAAYQALQAIYARYHHHTAMSNLHSP